MLAQEQTCATSVFKAGSKVFEGHEGNQQDVLKKGYESLRLKLVVL